MTKWDNYLREILMISDKDMDLQTYSDSILSIQEESNMRYFGIYNTEFQKRYDIINRIIQDENKQITNIDDDDAKFKVSAYGQILSALNILQEEQTRVLSFFNNLVKNTITKYSR